jgi:hypothetical protein
LFSSLQVCRAAEGQAMSKTTANILSMAGLLPSTLPCSSFDAIQLPIGKRLKTLERAQRRIAISSRIHEISATFSSGGFPFTQLKQFSSGSRLIDTQDS